MKILIKGKIISKGASSSSTSDGSSFSMFASKTESAQPVDLVIDSNESGSKQKAIDHLEALKKDQATLSKAFKTAMAGGSIEVDIDGELSKVFTMNSPEDITNVINYINKIASDAEPTKLLTNKL